MIKMKKVMSLLLMIVFVLSLGAVAFASPDNTVDELISKEELELINQKVLEKMLEGDIAGIDELEEVKHLKGVISNNPDFSLSYLQSLYYPDSSRYPVEVYSGVMIDGVEHNISVFENGSILVSSMTARWYGEIIPEDINDVTEGLEKKPKEQVDSDEPVIPDVAAQIELVKEESSESDMSVKGLAGTIRIEVDGKYIDADVKPFIDEFSRTQAPFRAIGEALGCKIEWSELDRKITCFKEDVTIELFIGNETYFVNGEPQVMDTKPLIKDDRTFVPVRTLGEALGCDVTWNQSALMVSVSSVGF